MAVTQVEKTPNVMPPLEKYNPTFLLLDFDMDEAENFSQEISKSPYLDPPPYILIADTFSDGADRAAALNLGADACIAKPISLQEVVALIQAVFRREHKIARLQAGRVTLHTLRQKLGLDNKDTDYIQTVYRIGYRFA